MGDVVDMNLDYFPDMIIVTFSKHQDVLKALEKSEISYENPKSHLYTFKVEKITFELPVRNCSVST